MQTVSPEMYQQLSKYTGVTYGYVQHVMSRRFFSLKAIKSNDFRLYPVVKYCVNILSFSKFRKKCLSAKSVTEAIRGNVQ